MIQNENQYNDTKKWIKEFEEKIIQSKAIPVPDSVNQQLRLSAYIAAINSQIEELKREVEEYENLVQVWNHLEQESYFPDAPQV